MGVDTVGATEIGIYTGGTAWGPLIEDDEGVFEEEF